jgi:hypothetical protein
MARPAGKKDPVGKAPPQRGIALFKTFYSIQWQPILAYPA